MPEQFFLPIPTDSRRQQAAGWLRLGIGSLALSGVFALLIVLSRTPYLDGVFPVVDFFHTALVVHVDLSVLVWFLAFAGVFWSLTAQPRHPRLGWAGLAVTAAGASIMALSPFVMAGAPIMSNYVPVLDQPMFLGGLLIVALGFTLLVARTMFLCQRVGPYATGQAALRFGLNTAAVAAGMALLAFTASYLTMPSHLSGKEYFEMLFWGGGHQLQFMYTQLMLVAWLWLAHASGLTPRIGPRAVLFMFGWGMLVVFLTPVLYLSFPVDSTEFRRMSTWQMAFGGSLAALPIALAIVAGRVRSAAARTKGSAERAALLWSMVLFGLGGVLGFMINGSNVTVPAHYHGSIVGVTLAFMGVTYHLLPKLGFAAVSRRLAAGQAHLFGIGQFMHVSGLAWAGANGVQRKTAGAAQALDTLDRILAMGLMGLGGLITIVGGVLFVVLALRALRWPAAATNRAPLHAG